MLTDKVTLIAIACVGTIAFGAGAYVTRNHYETKIATYLKEKSDEIAKIERAYQVKLAEAISDRDDAYRRVSDLDNLNRAATVKLRELSTRIANPVVRTVVVNSKEYERCSRLLQEGSRIISEQSELLGEGCRLYGRCAADKDAIADLLVSLEKNNGRKN